MSENLKLIRKKLEHLARMSKDLEYSINKMVGPLRKIESGQITALTLDERETISAFTGRFSSYQDYIGTTMRSVSIEEEINVDRFGSVLAFMEKLGIFDDLETWKVIRELRNGVSHDYEDDADALFQLLNNMIKNAPYLFNAHNRLSAFVDSAYRLLSDNEEPSGNDAAGA